MNKFKIIMPFFVFLLSISCKQIANDNIILHSDNNVSDKPTILFNGKFVYSNGINIYTANIDGTNQNKLTKDNSDSQPKWSPDGTKIIFTRVTGRYNIPESVITLAVYIMNSDGTDIKELVKGLNPNWSPDGNKIAFSNEGLAVINPDGTNYKLLTETPASTIKWSPDGNKIIFNSKKDGYSKIYVINADGTNQINLTNSSNYETEPNWSPDSNKIIFTSYDSKNEKTRSQIYVVAKNGTNKINLSNNPYMELEGNYSPDGTKIAFRSDRDGLFKLYVMNADGTDQRSLSDNCSFYKFLSWLPYKNQLLVSEGTGMDNEIYIINIDGTNKIKLTNIEGYGIEYYFDLNKKSSSIPIPQNFPSVINSNNKPKMLPPINPPSTLPKDLSNAKFTYSSDGHIYVKKMDGAKDNILIDNYNSEKDYSLKWSPDRAKIVFKRKKEGYVKSGGGPYVNLIDIYVMNADGTNQNLLIDNVETVWDDIDPTWSPYSKKIAFSKDGLCVIDADGKNYHLLNNVTSYSPNWSPNGKRIAFWQGSFNASKIYVINADGTNQILLANGHTPVWSPDGTKIAFRIGEDKINIMNSDGTNQTFLVYGVYETYDHPLVWAPDGKKIVFTSDKDGVHKLYVINTDGTNQTKLVNNCKTEIFSSWSPDSTKIVFLYSEPNSHKFDVYIINTDGTNLIKLNDGLINNFLNWSWF